MSKQVAPPTLPPQSASAPRSNPSGLSFAIAAARHAADTRCTDVVLLDLTGISPICDYFVIGTGSSARQMRTVGSEVAELAEQSGQGPLGGSDSSSDSWVLVDCVDVLVHIFSVDARGYYDLENLWSDAKRIEWKDAPSKEA